MFLSRKEFDYSDDDDSWDFDGSYLTINNVTDLSERKRYHAVCIDFIDMQMTFYETKEDFKQGNEAKTIPVTISKR